MASKIRLNFHSDSEAMINKQINLELFASYTYMAMVSSLFRIYILNDLIRNSCVLEKYLAFVWLFVHFL